MRYMTNEHHLFSQYSKRFHALCTEPIAYYDNFGSILQRMTREALQARISISLKRMRHILNGSEYAMNTMLEFFNVIVIMDAECKMFGYRSSMQLPGVFAQVREEVR